MADAQRNLSARGLRNGDRFDDWPEGFYWSEADERPVFSPQRDDAGGEGLRVAVLAGPRSVSADVPHLERACELLWQHGHPRIAEALEREVKEALGV